MWRNWYTRTLEVRVALCPCEFESRHPHWIDETTVDSFGCWQLFCFWWVETGFLNRRWWRMYADERRWISRLWVGGQKPGFCENTLLQAKRWEKTRFLRFDIQYIYFGSGSPKLIICCFGVAGTTAGTTVIPPRRSCTATLTKGTVIGRIWSFSVVCCEGFVL